MTARHVDAIRGARLLDGQVVDLRLAGGRVSAVAPTGEIRDLTGTVIDAGGRIVTESFVDAHLHLDKVFTLPRLDEAALTSYSTVDMAGAATAIDLASEVKAGYDRAWIEPNVRRALDLAVAYGVLHIQAFVDTDSAAGLVGMDAVLAVREEYRGRLELQIVAFPQDGVLRDPGAAELCEAALRLGADVVGGIPWIEESESAQQAHVEWACALAARTGRRVAVLTDDTGDARLWTTTMLADAMVRHGLRGRGVACHARALGRYDDLTLDRLVRLARNAGLGFVSDPHTGPLHLPVRRLVASGLPVALGQDDIEDAYYPFGRHNMLEVAFLAAHLLGFVTDADQRVLVELVTTRAAEVLGIEGHRTAVGRPANICIHDCERVVDLLREHQPPRWVLGGGRVVAETDIRTTLLG